MGKLSKSGKGAKGVTTYHSEAYLGSHEVRLHIRCLIVFGSFLLLARALSPHIRVVLSMEASHRVTDDE